MCPDQTVLMVASTLSTPMIVVKQAVEGGAPGENPGHPALGHAEVEAEQPGTDARSALQRSSRTPWTRVGRKRMLAR